MSAQLALPLPSLPHSIVTHPRWAEIAPLLLVEPAEPGRVRLEFKRCPPDALAWLLGVEVACAGCRAPIRPVRSRKAKGNARSETVGHGLYLGVTCLLEVRLGCSRGRAARDEYVRIQRALEVQP